MRLLVYPYGYELSPFARYPKMLPFDEVILSSPKSWGLIGEDVSVCYGGAAMGVNCIEFNEAIDNADTVLFDLPEYDFSHGHYEDNLKLALSKGKEIYVTKSFSDSIPVSASDNVKILGFDDTAPEESFVKGYNKLLQLDKPVIAVFGIGDNCSKFDIQLGLRDYLQNRGFKVFQWGTKEYSNLFGFGTVPEFVFSPMKLTDKILSLNHYLYKQAKTGDYDVAIVGIPGAIMPVNPYSYSECGEAAFALGMAINIDIGILSLYANSLSDGFISELTNMCKYRHNLPVDYVFVSNNSLDFNVEKEEISYFPLTKERIIHTAGDYMRANIDNTRFIENEDIDRVCGNIIKKLQENI